jgi:hypothetical protein
MAREEGMMSQEQEKRFEDPKRTLSATHFIEILKAKVEEDRMSGESFRDYFRQLEPSVDY